MINIIFFGTSLFAVNPLKYLIENGINISCIVTKPDAPKGRYRKIQGSPIKEFALKFKIPIYQPKKINHISSIQYLKSFNPDFLVVISYGEFLSQAILEIPKILSVNIHASLLPSYRGAAPIERAIMEGEKKTGVTLIKIEKELDAGPIYLKEEVKILPNITAGELSLILSKVSEKVILNGLLKIKNKSLKPKKQNHSLSTYAHKITLKDKYLSFNTKGIDIINKIRALQPRTNAIIEFKGMKIGICKAESIKTKVDGKYGEIIKIDKNEGILVKCKDGYIIIKEIKAENRKRMRVSEFLNGTKVFKGDHFDSISIKKENFK